ncbi:MAG: hypothetical protein J07HR59_01354 [Halorubrum sp. J07HR59]|nr:MAG: hypothetical protein J07HR59_01354 [Halorubrum sp. J07HR59]
MFGSIRIERLNASQFDAPESLLPVGVRPRWAENVDTLDSHSSIVDGSVSLSAGNHVAVAGFDHLLGAIEYECHRPLCDVTRLFVWVAVFGDVCTGFNLERLDRHLRTRGHL